MTEVWTMKKESKGKMKVIQCERAAVDLTKITKVLESRSWRNFLLSAQQSQLGLIKDKVSRFSWFPSSVCGKGKEYSHLWGKGREPILISLVTQTKLYIAWVQNYSLKTASARLTAPADKPPSLCHYSITYTSGLFAFRNTIHFFYYILSND